MSELSYEQRKELRRQKFNRTHGGKMVECTACSGSGRYDHNGSPPCGCCGGRGKVSPRD